MYVLLKKAMAKAFAMAAHELRSLAVTAFAVYSRPVIRPIESRLSSPHSGPSVHGSLLRAY